MVEFGMVEEDEGKEADLLKGEGICTIIASQNSFASVRCLISILRLSTFTLLHVRYTLFTSTQPAKPRSITSVLNPSVESSWSTISASGLQRADMQAEDRVSYPALSGSHAV